MIVALVFVLACACRFVSWAVWRCLVIGSRIAKSGQRPENHERFPREGGCVT